jgi:hypothetical protein
MTCFCQIEGQATVQSWPIVAKPTARLPKVEAASHDGVALQDQAALIDYSVS